MPLRIKRFVFSRTASPLKPLRLQRERWSALRGRGGLGRAWYGATVRTPGPDSGAAAGSAETATLILCGH